MPVGIFKSCHRESITWAALFGGICILNVGFTYLFLLGGGLQNL
jgi:hypothetical protein